MSQAVKPISLLLVCQGVPTPQQERLIADIRQEGFGSAFALGSQGTESGTAGLTLISEAAVGGSVLRRLEFLADAEQLPYLLAPLLLSHLWNQGAAGDVVIVYPGISHERCIVARELIQAGCEAVLLRSDYKAALVLALAHTSLNQRLVAHWADRIERASSDPQRQDEFDPLIGSSMVEHVCDRVGSLRQMEGDRAFCYCSSPARATEMAPLIRSAIRKLLPESQLLLEDPFENAVQALTLPAPDIPQDPGNLITCLMSFIWSSRADLQEAFVLSTYAGRQSFVDWFLSRASIELALSDEYVAPVRREHETPSSTTQPNQPEAATERQTEDPLNFSGLNLVGYPRAEMGMGEQLRACAAALSTAGVQLCIKDFNFGIIASNRDTRFEHLVKERHPFQVNLFHINADQMPLAEEKLGREFFRDHYNIGYWEWELSNFPDEWRSSIDLVDEVWAPSKFIQRAISKKTAKPVVWMPLAIEFPVPAEHVDEGNGRKKFGLPEDPFLFLFTFDFSSFATRKNFRACIEAFRKAFAETDDSVGLVLKTIRHPHHRTEFWDLLRAVGNDRRVHVIDSVLRQGDMRQLIGSCDSFVSLHRSEGFGLGIAEAMYLGKPVIVTNYSGNVDFTTKDNSCLVEYRLVPVKTGEYVFPDGQVWADPNIDHAAMYMRRLVEDAEYAKSLGRAAARFIRQRHNCKTIGERYMRRLKQIGSARSLLAVPNDISAEEDYYREVGGVKAMVKKMFQAREAGGA